MKGRNIVIPVFLLALVFLVFMIRRWNEPVRKEAFDRHPASVIYTKHALCRMDCRHIDKDEIKEIIEKGIINFSKTKLRDRPCPSFALQGRTQSGENIRVILAQCPTETKVITCYNLEEEFECHCPGDASKNSRQAPKNHN